MCVQHKQTSYRTQFGENNGGELDNRAPHLGRTSNETPKQTFHLKHRPLTVEAVLIGDDARVIARIVSNEIV